MDELLSGLLDNFDLLHAILLLIGMICSCIAAHSGTSKNVAGSIASLISQAESKFGRWEQSGELKQKWVVEQLRNMVPALLLPSFSEEKLEAMVSGEFTSIDEFARMQLSSPATQGCTEDKADKVFTESPFPIPEKQGNGGEEPVSFRVEYLSPDELKVVVCPKRAELRDV